MCKSDFVNHSWLAFLDGLLNTDEVPINNWLRISFAQFHLIDTFCELAEITTTHTAAELDNEIFFLSQMQIITNVP